MSLGRVSECIYKTPPDKSAAISGGLTERQSQTARLRHRERRSSRLKQIFFEVPPSVASQNPTQMPLAKNDEMVDALAADGSDQPFRESVLPGRRRANRLVSYAHGA